MTKSQDAGRIRWLLIAFFGVLLTSCSTVREAPPPICQACPVCPAPTVCPSALAVTPAAKPLQRAQWSDLPGWGEDDLVAAWPAFLLSCRALESRPQWLLWRAACEEARALPAPDRETVRRYFESRFEPYQMINPDGTERGLVTGYYEPLLRGSRTKTSDFAQPVLGIPPDLLTIDLGEVAPDLKNMRLRGRLVGNRVVPYYSRADIVSREQNYADQVLLWVDDPVELFFLQIQGSGRVRLKDGSMVRVGYADQNGHPYQPIGRVLAERGELKLDQTSMQNIQAWARANPGKLSEILNANPSFVFFRELPAAGRPEEGPPGALGVPLTPERSIAVDPRNIPLGAPVFLATTRPNTAEPLRRLMLAQDTGGAIRGAVRADYFWGFGAGAGQQAGRMRQSGQMWVLLPPGLAPK